MAYQNAKYHCNWKPVHDRHAPKRQQAMAKTYRLAGAGQMYTPAQKGPLFYGGCGLSR
jgi:hypothetical protein